ncbi:hypothetical protein AC628_05780 [Bradyrhizobium sp. NAS96.2]|nr:hypothetical protein AC628_05780 [Bradyrhizobium sp. NAS96.2]
MTNSDQIAAPLQADAIRTIEYIQETIIVAGGDQFANEPARHLCMIFLCGIVAPHMDPEIIEILGPHIKGIDYGGPERLDHFRSM